MNIARRSPFPLLISDRYPTVCCKPICKWNELFAQQATFNSRYYKKENLLLGQRMSYSGGRNMTPVAPPAHTSALIATKRKMLLIHMLALVLPCLFLAKCIHATQNVITEL